MILCLQPQFHTDKSNHHGLLDQHESLRVEGLWKCLKSKSSLVLQLCVINLAEAEVERYEILPHNDNNLKLLVKKVKYTTED